MHDFVVYAEDTDFYGHPWLSDTYFRLVNAKVLLEPHPQVAPDDHIVDQAILASTKQCGRDKWTEIASSQIRLLGKTLAEEIDKQISEVGDAWHLCSSRLTLSLRSPWVFSSKRDMSGRQNGRWYRAWSCIWKYRMFRILCCLTVITQGMSWELVNARLLGT